MRKIQSNPLISHNGEIGVQEKEEVSGSIPDNSSIYPCFKYPYLLEYAQINDAPNKNICAEK